MFKKIYLKPLSSNEFYQFMHLVLGIVTGIDTTKNKIKPFTDAFATLENRLLAALNRIKAYELTAVIDALDVRRDKAYSGLSKWIHGLTSSPTKTTRDAALVVENFLKGFGTGITKLNQQAETAQLSKIIADYKANATVVTALTLLNGKDWMIEIEDANTQFETKYQERSKLMGVDDNKETFGDVRLLIETFFDEQLLENIKARLLTFKADGIDTKELQQVVDSINATIDQYATLIKTAHAPKPVTKKEEPKP